MENGTFFPSKHSPVDIRNFTLVLNNKLHLMAVLPHEAFVSGSVMERSLQIHTKNVETLLKNLQFNKIHQINL